MVDGMDDDISELLPPGEQPPVRTQQELFDYWRALMGPLGFSRPMLWVCFISADDVVAPVISQIDDLPKFPDRELLTNLMWILKNAALDGNEGSSVAMLLSRPGRSDLRTTDRAWARGLASAASASGVPLRPLYLATDESIRVVAVDDLLGPDAA